MCIEMINYNKNAIENGKKIKLLLKKNKMIKKIGFNFIFKPEPYEIPVVNHKDYLAKINEDNKFPIKKIIYFINVL